MHRNKHESPLKLSFDIVEMELADINDLMEIERLSFPTPWSKNFFVKEYQLAAQNYNIRKAVKVIEYIREYDLKSKGVNNVSSSSGELTKELVFKILH